MAGDGPARDPREIESHALLGDEVRTRYLAYYRHVFRDGVLDMKTKELIALGVSLGTGARNCIEGHMRKLVELGATRAELEEVVAVTLGVAAASVVDRADIAYADVHGHLDRVFAARGDER